MITIFNRKELLITYDHNLWLKVRDVLDANQIDHKGKMSSQNHPGYPDTHVGSIGIREDAFYEYKIWVHKKDFDKAARLVNSELNLKIISTGVID